MRKFLVCGPLILGFAAPAAAAPLGADGQLTISAENIMSLSFAKVSGEDSSSESIYYALLGNPSFNTPFDVPRLGVDFFAGEAFSLGAAVGYAHLSPDGGEGENAFLIHPRVGWNMRMSDSLAFWLRGGLTYYNVGNDDFGFSGLALDASGLFMLQPTEHWAAGVGPVVDVGLTGDHTIQGTDTDARLTSFGATACLTAWF